MANETLNPFIFFLTLEDQLPKNYYIFDRYLKDLGFILVPVKIDQLQSLVSASDQEQVIVLCSVSDSREYRIYNEKVRGFLKFILKSKRITFMHMSSFSKLNDQRLFALQKNYYFFKFPFSAKDLSFKISRYHALKKDQRTIWPGGRRATLGSGAV
jgi:hypothetical protein